MQSSPPVQKYHREILSSCAILSAPANLTLPIMEYPKLMNNITNNLLPFELVQNFITSHLIKKKVRKIEDTQKLIIFF